MNGEAAAVVPLRGEVVIVRQAEADEQQAYDIDDSYTSEGDSVNYTIKFPKK